MKTILILSCMVICATINLFAQQSISRSEENIKKVKENLSEKLLTTADEVIEHYLEAIGGKEAILAIKTMTMKVRMVRFGQNDIPILRYYKAPNYFRAQRTPTDTYYTLSDGDKTWAISPNVRKELSEWWAKSLSHHRIDGNFIDYKERGIEYEYIGLKSYETESFVYYHLRRTFPDGIAEELMFDIESGLLHSVLQLNSPNNNSPQYYYDYRKVGDVLFPHTWIRVFNNSAPPGYGIVEEILINEYYTEDFFK